MDIRELRHHLRSRLEPVVSSMGYDLVAIEWFSGPKRQVLRVSVDKPNGGIGADDCAAVSMQISPVLDADDPIPGAYDLEVSSPGLARPLQRRQDFARFKGYQARIRLEPGPARRRFAGALRGVSGDFVCVEVDGERFELDLDQIEAAHLLLSLEAYQQLSEGLPPVPHDELDGPPDDTQTTRDEQARSAVGEAE